MLSTLPELIFKYKWKRNSETLKYMIKLFYHLVIFRLFDKYKLNSFCKNKERKDEYARMAAQEDYSGLSVSLSPFLFGACI